MYGDSPAPACRGSLLGADGALGCSTCAHLDRRTSPTFALHEQCTNPFGDRSQPDPSPEHVEEKYSALF